VNAALAFAAAALLAGLARGLGWLTSGGAAAAALIGGLVFWGAGLTGGSLLALFFVSGSLLDKVPPGRPAAAGASSQHGARNVRQVIANGGWAAVAAAVVPARPETGWPLLAGALAAAQADTWATEIGMRSGNPPRSIITGAPVSPGTSGGITPLGTAAGLLGSVALAGLGWALGLSATVAASAAAAGVLGMTVDSLLGASLQAAYRCEACRQPTEHRVHGCGRPARRVRGLPAMDNDAVNLVATSAGAWGSLLLFKAVSS
jgi:uncharacterized protein (TIGR00297 family)